MLQDILRCTLSSRPFHDLIESSKHVQFHIALVEAGLNEHQRSCGSKQPMQDKISHLSALKSFWRDLDFIHHEHDGILYHVTFTFANANQVRTGQASLN
jgi:hypothetical protein